MAEEKKEGWLNLLALTKKKPVYYLGLLVGLVGLAYFANGFLLFLPA
ncbi:MAG: hypothetical protein HGB30_04065 [Holophagaceae bacterium]|nr:hypothetical protein [Holophagaceae bacterium]